MRLRQLGLQPYDTTWRAMRDFTDRRDADSDDQLWLLQHPPTYTLGQAGRREHIHNSGRIPIVRSAVGRFRRRGLRRARTYPDQMKKRYK